MIAVIIAGGSGTRLWPLSTHDYPKQLLRLNGDKRSLLQNAYDRAQRLADVVYVMPETRLRKHVVEQLPKLSKDHLIVEPALRGTAGCVAAALAHIAKTHDPDEPLTFLWADHFIRDLEGFVHSLQLAAEAVSATGRIVLVGVEPDYPATGFEYIEKGLVLDEQSFIANVKSFQKRPAYTIAQKYLRSGNYLWNAGYSVGSIRAFTMAMKQHAPEFYGNYERLLRAASPKAYDEAYHSFEPRSIEQALILKVPDLLVVPANFDWLDIGSFSDMYKVVDHDEQGNHLHGRIEAVKVENSFIHNHEDKPLAVIGLDNVVVVNTPNGILVARKDLSQAVGEIGKRFNG